MRNWQLDLLGFLILILTVALLQYLLLTPLFNYGFTPDDWGLLLFYKTLGDNPLSKIAYVWSIKGAYTTSQVYFIGILNSFFGLNYQYYQITNIILKLLATLSLYPLIVVVFKKRLLAFLTTFLYGISYMASRSLEYVVKGTDYLAIIPMNLFFIVYFFIVREKLTKLRWFFLMSFLWFTSLMISPIRLYPILVLIPLIELILWLQNRSRKMILNSLKRLSILYIPFLLIYLYKPSSIIPFLQNPQVLYQAILKGNWHLILTPFQGVGLTVLTNGLWSKLIGNLDLTGFEQYLLFLIRGPVVIFGFLVLILSLMKSKKSDRFFLQAFFLNLILEIFFYFIAVHEMNIPENLRLHFDPTRMYPVIISGFTLAISFTCFLEWKREGKHDNLLVALWVSPPIILLYTLLIWMLAPFGVGFEGQQGYYLVLPAIASSLFLAAILAVISDKVFSWRAKFSKLITVCGILITLLYIYLLNRNDIYYFFSGAGINGRYAADQEKMYSQVLSHINNLNHNEPTLFYFDVSEDGQRGTFYTESLLSTLTIRLRIKNKNLSDGCAGVFYEDIQSLKKLITIKDGIKGFLYQGQCIKDGKGGNGNTGGLFFTPGHFYAFKLKDGNLTDIKKEVLAELEFE